MSQSGRLLSNQPVPGAGIQTVTGNAGGPVPGDGAANINLVGAGTIVVTGSPGAHSLTISSTAVPATYTTDTGVAVPDMFGNLNVFGGLNINTDNTIANTVRINLDDTIFLAGDLNSDKVIATGNITSIAGDIETLVGDIVSAGFVIGDAGGVFHDQVVITANGIESTGPTILNSLGRGVVQVDDARTLFSDEGLDGQILIGSTVGAARWRNLTVGGGIIIGNGHNSIVLQAAGSVLQNTREDDGFAHPIGGLLNIMGLNNITTHGNGANTVAIILNDTIVVDSVFTTGIVSPSIVTGVNSDIVSGGDIRSEHDIISVRDITVGNNLNVNDIANTTHLYVANTTTLNSERGGVLQTDGAGLVRATNAANGSVLIGTGVGVAPVWNTLTAGPGINIVNEPGHITVSSIANTQPLAFRAQMNPGVDYAGNAGTPPYYFGTSQVLDTIFDTNGTFYPGDGLLAPATFTAPYDGIFSFTMTICLSFTTFRTFVNRGCWLMINDTGSPFVYRSLHSLSSPSYTPAYYPQPPLEHAQYTEVIHLTAGSIVTFGVEPKRIRDTSNQHYRIGPTTSREGQTSITGFLVRRM